MINTLNDQQYIAQRMKLKFSSRPKWLICLAKEFKKHVAHVLKTSRFGTASLRSLIRCFFDSTPEVQSESQRKVREHG